MGLDRCMGHDLADDTVVGHVLHWIACGLVGQIFLAPPCESWSRARRGKRNRRRRRGFPAAVRAPGACIWGLDVTNMTDSDSREQRGASAWALNP